MTDKERDDLLKEMSGGISAIKTDVALLTASAKRYEKSLYGNGSPGLMTRVQKIEDCHENERKGVATFLAWLGAITSIIAVFCAVVALLK